MENHQYVELKIDRESYAVPILEIHEIIRMQAIAVIPNTRKYVRGVINLRGQIVPIVSLRERLGFPHIDETKDTRVVVVNHDAGVFGMIVDSVKQVTSFAEIQPPPEHSGDTVSTHLQGIGRKGEMLISILNLETLLQE